MFTSKNKQAEPVEQNQGFPCIELEKDVFKIKDPHYRQSMQMDPSLALPCC